MADSTVAEGEDAPSESNDTRTIEIELSEAMLTRLDIIRKLDSVDYTDASRGSALEVLIEGALRTSSMRRSQVTTSPTPISRRS